MTALIRSLLTAFGLGHLRPAPGTWGSTPCPAIALLLVAWLGRDGLTPTDGAVINATLVLLLLVFGLACIVGGAEAERRFGGKDPSAVVADEVAGQAVALLGLPWRPVMDAEAMLVNTALAGTAFVLFRVMDITKPPPADRLQSVAGGWGILLDDLVAGLYALLVVQVLWRWIIL